MNSIWAKRANKTTWNLGIFIVVFCPPFAEIIEAFITNAI